MEGIMTIELKQLRFFAFHGLYAEEKKTGNDFEVNLSISFIPVSGIITSLDETIDYSVIYDLVRTEMEAPRELLETLAMDILAHIHKAFPQVNEAAITIDKLHAPIPSFNGVAGVTYRRSWQ